MSLILAPYNDSMRLGMGFNSYTQQICSDRAVTVNDQAKNDINKSINYSSKCVDRLSDIVKSMNVSYSTSIKKGTVELAGDNTAINEEKVKESDINAVVSVRVVNQTTVTDEESVSNAFNAIEGMVPGTRVFDETFGDCYVSGWIMGGDFNAVISMRVLNRSNTDKVVSKVKQTIGNGTSSNESNLDIDTFSTNVDNAAIATETETTISVSWMGGGEIKPPEASWDLTSVYKAAAAFPSFVAQCPQKTWAILTKYKANRSYQEWVKKNNFRQPPLEYDLIAAYTADMFESYMEYKQLTKLVQDIIDKPLQYEARSFRTNNIPVQVPTLIAVRSAFRTEMAKIVRAVDILARDPAVLQREALQNTRPEDELVRRIIREATGSSYPAPTAIPVTSAPVFSPAGAGDKPKEVTQGDKSDSKPAGSTGNVLVTPTSEDALQLKSMIAPEIWADLLPTLKSGEAVAAAGTDKTLTFEKVASMFPPPSHGSAQGQPKTTPSKERISILVAICGLTDVTDTLRALVNNDDNTLTFQASAVNGFLDGYSKTSSGFANYLTLVYQYGSQTSRLVVAKPESTSGISDTTRTYKISASSTDFPEMPNVAWNADTFAISGFIYGAKIYHDNHAIMAKVRDQVRSSYDGGKGGRVIAVNNNLVGEDPLSGVIKRGIVFYQIKEGGTLKAAVGLEGGTPCILSDRLINDIADPSKPKVELKFDSGLKTQAKSKILTRDLVIQGVREKPFLEFPNGVNFYFQPDGNFTVYQNGQYKWSWAGKPWTVSQSNKWILRWEKDNRLCGYDEYSNIPYQKIEAGGNITGNPSIEGHLVFSDQAPYLEMGFFNNGTWQRTWASG